MCLIKTHTEIKTAEEDIPVYKVLRVDYIAPFCPWYRYRKGLNRPDSNPTEPELREAVESGYLHAFTNKDSAKKTVEKLKEKNSFYFLLECKVVKMYVPKGSKYWLGNRNDIAATAFEWREENE